MINPAGLRPCSSFLQSLKGVLIRHTEHLRQLLQILSHCASLSREAVRLPAPLPSLPSVFRVRLSIDKSLLQDYKMVITAGYAMTTVRDAIAGAFAWEKWLI